MSILSTQKVENHPFEPVLPQNATIMMMGSFPPTQDKWAMPFHYPNFYNDMWRVYGQVFFQNQDHFRVGLEKCFDYEAIIDFLHYKGIASCPTVRQAIREEGNASDKHLTVVTPVDLDKVLQQVPKVTTIFTTGGKATEVLLSLLNEKNQRKMPKTNQSIEYIFEGKHLNKTFDLVRLPSTSRAYPLSFAKKVAAYRAFFKSVNKVS